jgi:hypothetical protein
MTPEGGRHRSIGDRCHPDRHCGFTEALHVKVEPTTIDGVKAQATPETIPPENRNRLLCMCMADVL